MCVIQQSRWQTTETAAQQSSRRRVSPLQAHKPVKALLEREQKGRCSNSGIASD
jgi:hypothetical protein